MSSCFLRPASAGLGILLSCVSLGGSSHAHAEERKVFSGAFIGLDTGASILETDAKRAAKVGPRALTVGFRTSLALWEQVVLGVGMKLLDFSDRAPTSELVRDCQTVNGRIVSCDGPRTEKSDVQTIMLQYELGYQPQFRFADDTLRLSPALLLGYTHTLGPIERKVACVDCPEGEELPLSVSAPYLAGGLELAFPWAIGFALSVRSQWFLAGDFKHTTTCGLGYYIH